MNFYVDFFYTQDPEEAKQWDLNFKFIANDGGIFYTARIFFKNNTYFRSIFLHNFKESTANEIRLDLSSSTLGKYLLLLEGKLNVKQLTGKEAQQLLELADQHNMTSVIRDFITLLVDHEAITMENLLQLIDIYSDSYFKLDAIQLIRLEGFLDHLDKLNKVVIRDCFEQACNEISSLELFRQELSLPPKEYKKIALACYDLLPEKTDELYEIIKGIIFLHSSKSDVFSRFAKQEMPPKGKIRDSIKEIFDEFITLVNSY